MNTCLQRILLLPVMAISLALTACTVRVDKHGDDGDKKVKIDTPLGGIHVNTDRAPGSAGIDPYPGATLAANHDKGADVSLGFGGWQLRLQVEHYTTPDDRDKVLAYYRKALAKYGEVLECSGNHAVGQPEKTAEGLTCRDNDSHGPVHADTDGLTLRTGSPRRQHIVAFEKSGSDTSGPTGFALIALELPAKDWGNARWKRDRETD